MTHTVLDIHDESVAVAVQDVKLQVQHERIPIKTFAVSHTETLVPVVNERIEVVDTVVRKDVHNEEIEVVEVIHEK